MLVRWEEKYRVGNEQIDQEHQYLFQLINEFHDAYAEKRDRAILLNLLNRLVDYAERHFTNEEALMLAAGYPASDEHRAHHETLFEQIFSLNARFSDRAYNPARDATAFLKGWLADHILQEDLTLGAFLKATPGTQAGTRQTP